MNQELLNELRQISDEEQGYLKGQVDVDRGIYMEPETHMVDYKRLIESGKTIEIRTHTRFVHFPRTHTIMWNSSICVPDRPRISSMVIGSS